MPITFDRSVCCDLNETISREWIITNGLGGYAAGTVAGVLTRMEHGLLVAALPDAPTPQLLLAKIDEEVVFDQRTYNLGTNEYRDGTLNPAGFVHLESFRLEEGFPIFTYRLGGIDGLMLEKRIWMPQGLNTTYIQYRVFRTITQDTSGNRRSGITGALATGYGRYHEYATSPGTITLTLLPLAAQRSHTTPQYGKHDWHFQVQHHRSEEMLNADEQDQALLFPKGVAGCTIRAWKEAHPYHILAVGHPDSQVTFIPTGVWYWNFLRRQEATAGRSVTDDLYLPGVIRAHLWPGEESTLTIVVTAEEIASQQLRTNQLNLSYTRTVETQRRLLQKIQQPQRFFGEGGEAAQAYRIHALPLSTASDPHMAGEELLHLLLQAGNRFVVQQLPQEPQTDFFLSRQETQLAIISDYYSLEQHTRDTLIALPGLLLTTQRYIEAQRILRELARHFKQGLLPDRLPRPQQPLQDSDYGSADTTLWFFYALDHYLQATHHYEFLEELYHRLAESINWHLRGTLNGISVDTTDGLLRAEQRGKALTWMNAVVDGTPVTPRSGKPVEINALWYHALSLMHEWSRLLHHRGSSNHVPTHYQEQLLRCKQSFQQRFWYEDGGYLYDVLDGPDGADSALRPNQLFAFSLRYPVLEVRRRKRVFDAVSRWLGTPYGLRTLSPEHPLYKGKLEMHSPERLQALHQGSVWSWLIGPYIDAMFHLREKVFSSSTPIQKDLGQEYLWRRGIQQLDQLRDDLTIGLLGMNSGLFDGDEPHDAHHMAITAVSSGELLRTYNTLVHIRVQQPLSPVSA